MNFNMDHSGESGGRNNGSMNQGVSGHRKLSVKGSSFVNEPVKMPVSVNFEYDESRNPSGLNS